jgi:hypothetical protein
MLDWLREKVEKVGPHTSTVAEHEAFVELLVAAIYADHRVTQSELDAIEAFDASHADWDLDGFSVGQYFGPAAAKVRRAQGDGTIPLLVIEVSSRLSGLDVRDSAVAACEELLRYDGITADEQVFLDQVAAALA